VVDGREPNLPPTRPALLEGRSLTKIFHRRRLGFDRTHKGVAVDGVDVTVREGESVGIVGESGSGKTTLARVLARLERPSSGRVLFRSEDVTRHPARQLRNLRSEVRFMFQSPDAALNPRLRIREALAEVVRIQDGCRSRGKIMQRVDELCAQARLETRLLDCLPAQLSGGERRRVMVARSIAGKPSLILADEPVANLDPVIQTEILVLLEEIRARRRLAFVVITHDLAILTSFCERILVMKSGLILEEFPLGTSVEMDSTRHPYTRRLFDSSITIAVREGRRPNFAQSRNMISGGRVSQDPGPALRRQLERGCPYREECALFQKEGRPGLCERDRPPLLPRNASSGHKIACHLLRE